MPVAVVPPGVNTFPRACPCGPGDCLARDRKLYHHLDPADFRESTRDEWSTHFL